MIKFTKSEADLLIRVLGWVLIATVTEEKQKKKIENIRDKLKIALKVQPGKDVEFSVNSDETF